MMEDLAERQPVQVDGGQQSAIVTTRKPGGGHSLFGGDLVVVRDDSSQWMAWEGAQRAWLADQLCENTRRSYEVALRQFFDWFGLSPWEVGTAAAQEWKIYLLEEEELADSTVNLKLAALSSFYTFVQVRYTARTPDGRELSLWPADRSNPFTVIRRLKVSPYGRSKFPSTAEVQAMMGEINTDCLQGKRDLALLYTFVTTCRRSSEVLNLRWGDLHEKDDGDFYFDYRYKGGDRRKAVLNRLAYQAICAYLKADGRLETMGAGDYVFVPLDPERILRMRPGLEVDPNQPLSNRTANGILKKYARRAGVDEERAHLHGLRHAGARLRVEQQKANGGVDYVVLMQLLGHSSLAVTQIYSQEVLEEPEDPGGEAAARALLPTGKRRRRRQIVATQERLL